MTMNAPRRCARLVVGLVLLCGCPKRFDPRAETVRSSPDPEADHAYREARARLEVGDLREAQGRFKAFREKYPADPLAVSAQLAEARAHLGLGQPREARRLLEGLEVPADPAHDPTRKKRDYLLGLALHQSGEWQRSRETLQPFADQIVAGDDAVELHAVLADDLAQLGQAEAALAEFERYYAGARPPEKKFIQDRVAQLCDKLPAGEAARLWNTIPKDGVAAAFLGARVAADYRAAGDEAGARTLLEEARRARVRIGLEEARREGPRVERTVGLLLPLSGRGRALGERALRGALLGADVIEPAGGVAPVELRVRDTASDPARAQAALEELAKEGVVAILGPPSRLESQAAAQKAETLGVPYFELAPDDDQRGAATFKLVRSRRDQGAALVARAARAGAKTCAVLAADSSYGRAMAEAITQAAQAAGLKVLADLRYPDRATTFVDPAKRLEKLRPDALFIPAPASQLMLIAPQLSVVGLVYVPGVKPSGKLAKVYATGDGLSASFLQSTSKYLQGAVLAPAFYAHPEEQPTAAFTERYRAAYNEEPTTLDALAFDAVRAARLALDRMGDRPTRGELGRQLQALDEIGTTGELAFRPGGERTGQGLMFTIEGDVAQRVK
jgi:ABC-type branched-subunit amino acid transport system substrate-binding protein